MINNINEIDNFDGMKKAGGQGGFKNSVEKQPFTSRPRPMSTPFSGVQKFKESAGQVLADIGEAIARFESRNG